MLEPLTPPDCDLRQFHFMPFEVGKLRDGEAVAVLNAEEFRAAIILWCACWHQVPAASLPTDDRILARLAGFGRDTEGWMAVKSGALHGFEVCTDGRLYHPTIAAKARESWGKMYNRPDRALERSDHARKAATKRWEDRRCAGAMPEQSSSITPAVPEQCSTDALKGSEKNGDKTDSEIQDGETTGDQSLDARPVDFSSVGSQGGKGKKTETIASTVFEEFWAAYPTRDGSNPKAPAWEKFKVVLKTGVDANTLITSARSYADELRKNRQNSTQFVAQAVTWLNEKRWQDYVPTATDEAAQEQRDLDMARRGMFWIDGKWQSEKAGPQEICSSDVDVVAEYRRQDG